MDHHFNPRFYLAGWAGADHRVCEMRFVRGKVVAKRKFPQNTGYIKDLYRTNGVSDDIAQNLETHFFSFLDGKAARVMQRLLAGDTSLAIGDRADWARFLLSLLYRNREGVTLIKEHMAELVRATSIALEEDWQKRRRPEENRSLVEAFANQELGYAEIHAAKIIVELIANHRALPDIIKMRWAIINLQGSNTPLLTSDRPVFFGALSDPKAYIALPLGPYRLFVAAYDDRFSQSFDPAKVAYAMNRDVVANGREFIWGLDDSQIDFVRTWIASNTDRVHLSEEQRKAAVESAGKHLPLPDENEAA